MNRSLIAAVSLIAVAVSAFAQSPDGRAATIEDAFLRQRIELQILRSQARSTDLDSKMMALKSIEEMHNAGSLRADGDFFDIVELLATEGTSYQVRSEGRVINNYPVVRMRAASLLGEIGGSAAQGVLLKIVREDPEPMVLAEAIYALGKIGPQDRADQVVEHIIYTLVRENARIAPDNNLALATLLALGKLFEAGMEFRNEQALSNTVGLIIDISTNYRYITPVRERARDLLERLMAR